MKSERTNRYTVEIPVKGTAVVLIDTKPGATKQELYNLAKETYQKDYLHLEVEPDDKEPSAIIQKVTVNIS